MHEDIIEKLYQEYIVRGFISEDHIFDVLEENGISLFDVEYICDHLLSKGVIIRDDALTGDKEDEYEEVFSEVLEIDDTFTDFIEYIRGIKPPQHREWMNLMPQVKLNNTYARNRIFEMYMRVAVRIALIHAKRYHLPLDETIQNAMLGLHVSIDKYETVRQENFASYFPLWVFPNIYEPEKPMHPDYAYHRLKTLLKQAELPLIRFHDLRHTFATHALAGGVDAKTLSGILGHTNASFTLDTYTHVTTDMQRNASAIVGSFMDEIMLEGDDTNR